MLLRTIVFSLLAIASCGAQGLSDDCVVHEYHRCPGVDCTFSGLEVNRTVAPVKQRLKPNPEQNVKVFRCPNAYEAVVSREHRGTLHKAQGTVVCTKDKKGSWAWRFMDGGEKIFVSKIYATCIKKAEESSHTGLIVAIVISLLLLIGGGIGGVFYYRKKQERKKREKEEEAEKRRRQREEKKRREALSASSMESRRQQSQEATKPQAPSKPPPPPKKIELNDNRGKFLKFLRGNVQNQDRDWMVMMNVLPESEQQDSVTKDYNENEEYRIKGLTITENDPTENSSKKKMVVKKSKKGKDKKKKTREQTRDKTRETQDETTSIQNSKEDKKTKEEPSTLLPVLKTQEESERKDAKLSKKRNTAEKTKSTEIAIPSIQKMPSNSKSADRRTKCKEIY